MFFKILFIDGVNDECSCTMTNSYSLDFVLLAPGAINYTTLTAWVMILSCYLLAIPPEFWQRIFLAWTDTVVLCFPLATIQWMLCACWLSN